jgi:hypothetical protein
MAAAKDMQDAKHKAAACLQRFEAFVSRIVKQQQQVRRLTKPPICQAEPFNGTASVGD